MCKNAQLSTWKMLMFSITTRDLFFGAASVGQNMLRAARRLREAFGTFETFKTMIEGDDHRRKPVNSSPDITSSPNRY